MGVCCSYDLSYKFRMQWYIIRSINRSTAMNRSATLSVGSLGRYSPMVLKFMHRAPDDELIKITQVKPSRTGVSADIHDCNTWPEID